MKNRKRQAKRKSARNGCTGKKRFDLDTSEAASKMLATHERLDAMFIYLCNRGPHYHLTRSSRSGWIRKLERDE